VESSSALHTIRLAGPWEFQAPGGAGDWQTIKVPADWKTIITTLKSGGAHPGQFTDSLGANGAITARRRFQRPTGLDGGVRVWIVVPGLASNARRIQFNGAEVSLVTAANPDVAFDVTEALQSSNVVAIEFDIDRLMADDAAGGVFHGVLIEIRGTAHAGA
jgi:hypothetical protein